MSEPKKQCVEAPGTSIPRDITPTLPTTFILGCARTATGRYDGQFSDITAAALGATAITYALLESSITSGEVDEVIMGQVLTTGQGPNPVRQAANSAGIPFSVAAYSVNMHFGSGLKCVAFGMQSLACGEAKIVVCGGQDSYSQSHFSGLIRCKRGPHFSLQENIYSDVFIEPYTHKHILEGAQQIAYTLQANRSAQDSFAMHSHVKAKEACKNNLFDTQVAPVFLADCALPNTNHETIDPDISLESLKLYQPCLEKKQYQAPSVTHGNTSRYGDGASALVLCGAISLTPDRYVRAARIVSYVELSLYTTGGDITILPAIQKAISDAHWTMNNVDLYEIVEDSAAQMLAIMSKLKLTNKQVNIYGGSIATGNTIGDSSSKALVTLIHALKQNKAKRGIAASSAGAGMAIAIAIELCEPAL